MLDQGRQRTAWAAQDVAALRGWRLPLPAPGVSLQLASGEVRTLGLAGVDPLALRQALAPADPPAGPAWALHHAQAWAAARPHRVLQHPLARFAALPFLLAVPAFGLHQHIAFGSGLGELQVFGALAFAKGFALWWAAWTVGVVMVGAVLRAVVEAATLAVALLRPPSVAALRAGLERLALAALYLGVPAWLGLRLLAS